MVNVVVAENQRHNAYLESVFRIYEDIVAYLSYPTINNIYGDYCRIVDLKMIDVIAKFYPDDFYDGSPEKIPGKVIPDHMKDNMSDYIGMPLNITEDIIKEILDDHQMFYILDGYHHSPLKGVW